MRLPRRADASRRQSRFPDERWSCQQETTRSKPQVMACRCRAQAAAENLRSVRHDADAACGPCGVRRRRAPVLKARHRERVGVYCPSCRASLTEKEAQPNPASATLAIKGSWQKRKSKMRSPRSGRVLRSGDLFDEVDDAAAKLGVGDLRESARQRQSLGGRKKVRDVSGRGCFAETLDAGAAARTAFEQEGNRHLQNIGDLMQAARADAVGAFFVFLDLLKGQTASIAEFLLAQSQHDTTHPHVAANILVDRIWRFRRHRKSP